MINIYISLLLYIFMYIFVVNNWVYSLVVFELDYEEVLKPHHSVVIETFVCVSQLTSDFEFHCWF